MVPAILSLAPLILTALLLIFAFGPARRTPLAGIIRAFVAFYLIALGLGFIFGPPVGSDDRILLGALFAALGLTYFWVTRTKGVK